MVPLPHNSKAQEKMGVGIEEIVKAMAEKWANRIEINPSPVVR